MDTELYDYLRWRRASVPELFSIAPWRTVHDIHAMTRNRRRFVVDLYRDDQKRDEQRRYETLVAT